MMMREYFEKDVRTQYTSFNGTPITIENKYTNLYDIEFFILRNSEIREERINYVDEYYLNFHAFPRYASDYNPKVPLFTFSITKDFAEHNLKGISLSEFMISYGFFYLKDFLNSINSLNEFDLGQKNVKLLHRHEVGDIDTKNGAVIPKRDISDNKRLTALAEKAIWKEIVENDGLEPLSEIDMYSGLFIPETIFNQAKRKILREEFMDTEYGILSNSGEIKAKKILSSNQNKVNKIESNVTISLSDKEKKSVFISYSWDSAEHQEWVEMLATRLKKDGIRIIFDKFDLKLGDDIHRFMEESVTKSEVVLIICTPQYIEKANSRFAGVGEETMLVSTEFYKRHNTGKRYIPIIKELNQFSELNTPLYLGSLMYLDLSSDDVFDSGYQELITSLRAN